jgi:nicotinate-nucleotide adenylyltransferase
VTDARALGVLGGAFDPVHIGHLRGAIAVREHLGLERVDLLPAAQSPLKDAATVTAADRLAMLEAAVRGVPGLGIDARELAREGPSYTVDTLIELRREVGQVLPLIWIVGTDILPALPRWSRWQQLLELAHLVILERPGADSPPLSNRSKRIAHVSSRGCYDLRSTGFGHCVFRYSGVTGSGSRSPVSAARRRNGVY